MTIYYVSPTGNDSNAGTQAQPWRTAQHGIDSNIVHGGDTVIISGNIDFSGGLGTNGTPLYLVNKTQPGATATLPVTIQGAPGNVITCDAGPQGYNSCNFWVFDGLNVRVKTPGNGSTVGIYFPGYRASQNVSGGGSGGNYITVKNCTFDTTDGTGFIDRDGIGIWGFDHITVTGNTIKHTSNDLSSGGGSAISIGQPWSKSSEAGIHVRIERNLIVLIGPGTADNATDRNAIILDEYHTDSSGGPSGPAFPNFSDGHPGLIGDTLIANNIIMNITGRGIHVLKGGYANSKIGIINNTVIGPFAKDNGNLFPPCGIGGYGDNRSSNVTCFNNLVMDGNLVSGARNFAPYGMDPGQWVCANNWSYNGISDVSNGSMTVAEIGIVGGTGGTSTLLSDTFTGPNGSAPSSVNWRTPEKSAGATVDIQGNQLRMLGGSLGSYNDYQRIMSVASATDFTLTSTLVLSSDVLHDHYTAMMFRGSGAFETTVSQLDKQTTGYFVEVGTKENYIALFRRTGGADTDLGTVSQTWATGDVIVITVVCSGSSINVSYTRNGGASTVISNVTDATYATGPISLGQVGGTDDLVGDEVRWDSVTLTTSGSGNPALVAPTTDGTGNYRPSASSPLRLAGIASLNGWTAPTVDFYGQTRPSTPSIGAAEPVVAVNQPPVSNFSFSPVNAVFASPVQFTDLSTNSPTSWLWDFGDGVTSTLQNPAHTFTKAVVGGGPNPEAIAGMSATPIFDDGFANYGNWALYDAANGNGNNNGEVSAPRAANATVFSDVTATDGVCGRLIVKRENYFGSSYTGVQMESGAIHVGGGRPFYVEVRLRWTGYVGAWYGPWLLQYPASPPAEVDIMETVNQAEPRYALHSPNAGPSAYGPAQDPGQWHTYGLRFDTTGWKTFYDGVKLSTNNNAAIGTAFVNAQMFPKLQHLCGGSYPDGEAGFTTPLSSQAFPQNFDIDYYRVYQ